MKAYLFINTSNDLPTKQVISKLIIIHSNIKNVNIFAPIIVPYGNPGHVLLGRHVLTGRFNLNCKSKLQIQIANPNCKSKLQIQIANPNCKSKLQIQIANPNRKSKSQIQIANPNHKSKSKIQIENLPDRLKILCNYWSFFLSSFYCWVVSCCRFK